MGLLWNIPLKNEPKILTGKIVLGHSLRQVNLVHFTS